MSQLTKERVEAVIEEIKTELPIFSISEQNLAKFGTVDHMDNEYLSYVHGKGGQYVKFLALLTKKLQFQNIVELGNREGLSTLAIYDQLAANASFTTIDIEHDVRYCPPEMFTDPRVKFILGDVCSVDVLTQIPDGIDFLFTDTIHYDFQVRDEFEIYQHLLADTALVAIDDIHVNDKGKFWNDIAYEKWDLSELCHHNGWGLFLFERKHPEPFEVRWQKAQLAAARIWERKYVEIRTERNLLRNRSFKGLVKRAIKSTPILYPALCKINNQYNLIPPNTKP